MVGARRLVTVTLAWLFMGVDGYRPSSLADANVDVTEETPDSPGSANTSGIIQAQDSEQSENVTTLSCPCDLNECDIRYCCPPEYSFSFDAKNCTEDGLTPQVHGFEGSNDNYHDMSHVVYWWNDECWHTLIPHSRNGSICRMNVSEYPHFEDYCLYRELNKSDYGILRCIQLSDPNETDKVDYRGNGYRGQLIFDHSWIFACMGSASLVALATFIVYSFVPELKNFQGRIVRSYLASYFGCMILMTSLFSHPGSQPTASIVQVSFQIYFGLACLLWLNVMSFDIWRTFRKFRSNQAVDAKNRQRTTFVRYSLYAWGLPVFPALIVAIGWDSVVGVFLLVPLSLLGISVCDTYFFISTALTIRKCNKETAQTVDGASKHRQKNEQKYVGERSWYRETNRFRLYLKLFLIMGCPIILWAVSLAWDSRTYILIVFSVEPLQALCVFYMFVWKVDVRRSIRKRFAGMVRRLGCCRRRDSTSNIQNGNEEL